MYVYRCVQVYVHAHMPWCACAGQIPTLGMEGTRYSSKEKSPDQEKPREYEAEITGLYRKEKLSGGTSGLDKFMVEVGVEEPLVSLAARVLFGMVIGRTNSHVT